MVASAAAKASARMSSGADELFLAMVPILSAKRDRPGFAVPAFTVKLNLSPTRRGR
jgi:hypothetical protein